MTTRLTKITRWPEARLTASNGSFPRAKAVKNSGCPRMRVINIMNWPAAIISVLVRKLIDSRYPVTSRLAMRRASWTVDEYVNSNLIYVYLIGAALTYVGSHIRSGTIANMARRYSPTIGRKKKFRLNLRNRLSSRETEEKVRNYLSTQVPAEATAEPLVIEEAKPSPSPSETTFFTIADTKDQNPYCSGDFDNHTSPQKPSQSGQYANDSFGDSTYDVLYSPSVISDIIETFKAPKTRRKRRIVKEKRHPITVRKTRSGRIYGYCDEGARRKTKY